ncbi:exonuclease VII small subunit [Ehrlichia chaffeensis str. Heartland]|uniref:Exodeoxyribonuclease VII small subunit n=1 Tax=Ehrlichia chaffeensis (strain ATCC CRL-10679 / Arkansas) TaxID=205920 RepID=Q2GHP6_EHRCR|nr:exodeoxyribonuclease VII small subunit [Ehrlichia chaffeensis]ABD45454.1 putative exodeoxyribonuclease VII, small subunit [Ehrlichia chaffeensis str. Arkansas]AHX03350.1 exonuclease VII small subunit [Ehrlichia chaffeensis str. Heartland]AHX08655.1 exonuclease VII small subunit [Ehrlichia chaffeensis str. Saint Vincent]AHX10919.1 exonuclease VII small subunit [Ehrlichia chaffeensis str. West Paces]
MSINDEYNFEAAIEQLEYIVKELESDEVTLARSVELYSLGKELYEYCNKIIEDIELKIEIKE